MALDKTVIAAQVRQKFISSDLISNRTSTGSIKYYEEEIKYWTEKYFNSGWHSLLFQSEFNKTYAVNNDSALTQNINTTDTHLNNYIGQTFYIDSINYPRGMYISSICVFTALEDSTAPITLDVRPVINGVPTADILPFSKVIGMPYTSMRNNVSQIIPWISNEEKPSSLKNFVFEFPVYLSPGFYCFTLTTNSANYSVYVSTNGTGVIDTGLKVTNPYLGDFISSGQGESWIIDPTKDLCFMIQKANFEVGSKNLTLKTKKIPILDYDILNLSTKISEVIGENGKGISYISKTEAKIKEFSTLNETTLDILPNSNVVVPSHSTTDVPDGVDPLKFTLTLTNTTKDLTPIVDLQKTQVKLIKNIIDSWTQNISDSELEITGKGTAHAKYQTKAVTLNEGFDADGLTIYIDANTPEGTKIEVFYRVLNRYDFQLFDKSRWYLLPKKTVTNNTLSNDFTEQTYEDLAIQYSSNGTTYTTFDRLAVKVVFYSDYPTKVPSIKNLRIIATV